MTDVPKIIRELELLPNGAGMEAAQALRKLSERLEIWPVDPKTSEFDKSIQLDESCDGIACRDETIYQQDRRYEQQKARIEKLEAAGKRSLSWLTSYPGGGAMGAYEQMREALESVQTRRACDTDDGPCACGEWHDKDGKLQALAQTREPQDFQEAQPPEHVEKRLAAEPERVTYPNCKCDWHSYMVGDGCELCNPEKAAEYAAESKQEQSDV